MTPQEPRNPSDVSPPNSQETDLLEIHRAVLREPRELGEGEERGPWWLWTAIVLAIFGGGFYLGRFSGAFFKNTVHIGYVRPSMSTSTGPGGVAREPQAPTAGAADATGERVYTASCVPCHQGTGQGLPGSFPSLVNSEWVINDPETVVRIILHGMTGTISVKGETFDGVMPAWDAQLSDEDVAAVATYIRSSWGNNASPVDVELVRGIKGETPARTTPWTAAELTRLRSAPPGGTQ